MSIGEIRDREDCAGCFRKVSAQLLLAVRAALHRRDSFAHERFRFLWPDVPTPCLDLRFFASALLRARQMQSLRRPIRHICASTSRRARRVAQARRVVPGRDRVFLRKRKARGRFLKAQPRWRRGQKRIARSSYRSFPIRATSVVFPRVAREWTRLLRKAYWRSQWPTGSAACCCSPVHSASRSLLLRRGQDSPTLFQRSDGEADRALVRALFRPC